MKMKTGFALLDEMLEGGISVKEMITFSGRPYPEPIVDKSPSCLGENNVSSSISPSSEKNPS